MRDDIGNLTDMAAWPESNRLAISRRDSPHFSSTTLLPSGAASICLHINSVHKWLPNLFMKPCHAHAVAQRGRPAPCKPPPKNKRLTTLPASPPAINAKPTNKSSLARHITSPSAPKLAADPSPMRLFIVQKIRSSPAPTTSLSRPQNYGVGGRLLEHSRLVNLSQSSHRMVH
jgi:hypothetical protein